MGKNVECKIQFPQKRWNCLWCWCSACGATLDSIKAEAGLIKFCNNCGAKVVGEEEKYMAWLEADPIIRV